MKNKPRILIIGPYPPIRGGISEFNYNTYKHLKEISTVFVLNNNDEMSHVFDYDPLITEIEQLAGDGHYETQERLLTRIVHACANRPQVIAIEIYLRKKPVTFLGGTLGIRLKLDTKDLFKIRKNFSNNS